MENIGRATLQFARRMMQDPRYRDLIKKRSAELAAQNKTEGTNIEDYSRAEKDCRTEQDEGGLIYG